MATNKRVKKMAFGGIATPVGMPSPSNFNQNKAQKDMADRQKDMADQQSDLQEKMGLDDNSRYQGNRGGAMRGLDRAADRSGRPMPTIGRPASGTTPPTAPMAPAPYSGLRPPIPMAPTAPATSPLAGAPAPMIPTAPKNVNPTNAPLSPDFYDNMNLPPPGPQLQGPTSLPSPYGMKKGGAVKKPAKKAASGGTVTKMASGGYVRKADGIAQRGKTRGKLV